MYRKTAFLSFIILLIIGCSNPKKTSINLSELTISKIHDSYKNGSYSSEQLVKEYIKRIKAGLGEK